jgi:hypothetical protein
MEFYGSRHGFVEGDRGCGGDKEMKKEFYIIVRPIAEFARDPVCIKQHPFLVTIFLLCELCDSVVQFLLAARDCYDSERPIFTREAQSSRS